MWKLGLALLVIYWLLGWLIGCLRRYKVLRGDGWAPMRPLREPSLRDTAPSQFSDRWTRLVSVLAFYLLLLPGGMLLEWSVTAQILGNWAAGAVTAYLLFGACLGSISMTRSRTGSSGLVGTVIVYMFTWPLWVILGIRTAERQ